MFFSRNSSTCNVVKKKYAYFRCFYDIRLFQKFPISFSSRSFNFESRDFLSFSNDLFRKTAERNRKYCDQHVPKFLTKSTEIHRGPKVDAISGHPVFSLWRKKEYEIVVRHRYANRRNYSRPTFLYVHVYSPRFRYRLSREQIFRPEPPLAKA